MSLVRHVKQIITQLNSLIWFVNLVYTEQAEGQT